MIRVGVGWGVTVGCGVAVETRVARGCLVAVGTIGAGVTVGIEAMAVAILWSTICWTSASDGPASAQVTAPTEINVTARNQGMRMLLRQITGICILSSIIATNERLL